MLIIFEPWAVMLLQGMANSLDFIINSASGDIPFDPYLSLLKTAGVLVLVGFPSEVKFTPGSLILGIMWILHNIKNTV